MRTLYDTVRLCKNQADLNDHNISCFGGLFEEYSSKEAMKIVQFINECYNIDSEYQVYAKDLLSFLTHRASKCGISKDVIADVIHIGTSVILTAIEQYLRLQSDEEYTMLIAKRTLQANMQLKMISATADVNDLKICNEITNKTLEDIKNLEESIRGRRQGLVNGKSSQHISAASGKLNISTFVINGIPDKN